MLMDIDNLLGTTGVIRLKDSGDCADARSA
jgi:hypothetical protein